MTSASILKRKRHPLALLIPCLACFQWACSFRSLDYLHHGARSDAGTEDHLGPADAVPVPDGPVYDARTPDTGRPELAGRDSSDLADLAPYDRAIPPELPSEDGSALPDLAPDIGALAPDLALDGAPVLPDSAPDKSVGLTDTAPDSQAAERSSSHHAALLVVGETALGAGDSAIQSRLVSNGYDVTIVEDVGVDGITAVVQDVVIISSTCNHDSVATKFRSTPVPLMTWYSQIFAEMGFVDSTVSESSGETKPGATSLVVNSKAGELAAGLSGMVVVVSSSLCQLNWGIPSAQAITVASVADEPGHAAVFAYDGGAQMYGLVAPARRLGFFTTRSSATSLTANGWMLFDAALAWLTKP